MNNNLRNIFNVEKYSSFSKLLRVTVYVLRLINNARKSTKKLIGEITVKEIIFTLGTIKMGYYVRDDKDGLLR